MLADVLTKPLQPAPQLLVIQTLNTYIYTDFIQLS